MSGYALCGGKVPDWLDRVTRRKSRALFGGVIVNGLVSYNINFIRKRGDALKQLVYAY
jgi:hypothetical protein